MLNFIIGAVTGSVVTVASSAVYAYVKSKVTKVEAVVASKL